MNLFAMSTGLAPIETEHIVNGCEARTVLKLKLFTNG